METWTFTSGSWAWVALALVNAGLAEQKNRSRLTWFILSLFFGPLATAVIVIRAPAEPLESTPFRPFTNRADRLGLLIVLGLPVALLFALAAGLLRQPWYLAGTVGAIGFSAWLFFVGRRTTSE